MARRRHRITIKMIFFCLQIYWPGCAGPLSSRVQRQLEPQSAGFESATGLGRSPFILLS